MNVRNLFFSGDRFPIRSVLVVFLFFRSLTGSGQDAELFRERETPARMVGTNLIDFGPLITACATIKDIPKVVARYVLSGDVVAIVSDPPNAIILSVSRGTRFKYVGGPIQNEDNSDLLKHLAARNFAKDGYIDLRTYLMLSPSMRVYYNAEQVHEQLLVKNAPESFKVIGTSVDFFAWPTEKTLCTIKSGKKLALAAVDYGIPFNGSFEGKTLFRVSTAGVARIAVPTAEEVKDKNLQLQRNAFKFELKEAEAGSPGFQYKIGIHYLRGEGVERNQTLALEWLRKAADGGNAKALEELEKLNK